MPTELLPTPLVVAGQVLAGPHEEVMEEGLVLPTDQAGELLLALLPVSAVVAVLLFLHRGPFLLLGLLLLLALFVEGRLVAELVLWLVCGVLALIWRSGAQMLLTP